MRNRAVDLCVVTVLFLVPFAVQRPYFHEPFADVDDFWELEQVRRCALGEQSVAGYLFTSRNGHSSPLWRLWFFAQARLIGAEPWAWHAAIATMQGLGALALWALLRRHVGPAGALLGAGLWAGYASGSWDSPFLAMNGSHFIMALGLLFACLVAIDARACHDGRRRQVATVWAVAFASLMLAASSSFAALAPLVLLYALGPAAAADANLKRWLRRAALGLIALVALAALALGQAPPRGAVADMATMAQRWLLLIWEGLESLLVGCRLHPPGAQNWLLAALGGIVLVAAFWLARANRLARCFLAMALIYGLVIAGGRNSLPDALVFTFGRYYLLHAACAAVLLAVAFDRLPLRGPARGGLVHAWGTAAIVLVLLGGVAWRQHRVAEANVRAYCGLFATCQESLAAVAELPRLVAAMQSARGPSPCPDAWLSLGHSASRLSELACWFAPGPLPRLTPLKEHDSADVAALADWLAARPEKLAAHLAASYRDQLALRGQLETLPIAAGQQRLLPDVLMPVGPAWVALAELTPQLTASSAVHCASDAEIRSAGIAEGLALRELAAHNRLAAVSLEAYRMRDLVVDALLADGLEMRAPQSQINEISTTLSACVPLGERLSDPHHPHASIEFASLPFFEPDTVRVLGQRLRSHAQTEVQHWGRWLVSMVDVIQWPTRISTDSERPIPSLCGLASRQFELACVPYVVVYRLHAGVPPVSATSPSADASLGIHP